MGGEYKIDLQDMRDGKDVGRRRAERSWDMTALTSQDPDTRRKTAIRPSELKSEHGSRRVSLAHYQSE